MYYEDEIYHSAYSDGYLDGYYAGMELYHSDDSEMTEEERRARRKKRRRNIALGVAGVAGAGAAGYAIGRALRKRGRGIVPTGSSGPRGYIIPRGPRLIGGPSGGSTGPRPTGPSGSRGPRPTGPTLKRVHVDPSDIEEPIGWDFKRNRPRYRSDNERKSAPKPKRTISGFRRNKQYNFLRSPGSYKVLSTSENWIPFSVARDRKLKRK